MWYIPLLIISKLCFCCILQNIPFQTENTLSAITTNKKKEQCDKKYHLKMLLPLGFKP